MFCFGFLYMIRIASFQEKLMIHTDSALDKIYSCLCQVTKLTDTHSRIQQYHRFIITPAIGAVFTDKTHPNILLLRCHGNTLLGIVGHNIRQLKNKRILADKLLIVCHLKGWLDNATNACDCVVSLSAILKLYHPFLGIGNLNIFDVPKSEVLFLYQI